MMRQRGFTLMELVVYTGLFCLVGVLLAQMFTVSQRTQRTTASAYAVTGQAETCMQWLRKDFQDTVLGTVRTYSDTGTMFPMVTMISARSLDPKEIGVMQISEYGGMRWTKHVCYALKSRPGSLTGDLVRWEIPLSAAEKDRLPKVAAKPTAIPGDARVLLHNVLCPGKTVSGLGGRPNGWTADSKWGGFQVQFVRRAGGEGGAETMSDVNPSLDPSNPKDHTRLVQLQLTIKEDSVGPPNLYSITFCVSPQY